jgi:hypothetical protein
VGCPGTFNQESLSPSGEPVLELYDLQADPGEQRNLAAESPSVLAELRRGYDAWYDSVGSERGFTPGVIHVGNPRENPVRLCVYQDATFVAGKPQGWSVSIERAGRYRIAILPHTAAHTLHVKWLGKSSSQPISAGKSAEAEFDLSAGSGTLEVSFSVAGQPAPALGDVAIDGPLR